MLVDVHNHLQSKKLKDIDLGYMHDARVAHVVVNGTRESDWEDILQLCKNHGGLIPSIGLHPWWVKERTSAWAATMETLLRKYPQLAVGEVGLDRWIKDHDLPDQVEALRAQLQLAATYQRPVTIHCLQAWGALIDTLETSPLPECGFLVHSFGGSNEVARRLQKLGAYFSFSGYFAQERKRAQQEVFKQIPIERLLLETDAPDMHLPESLRLIDTRDENGEPVNHPQNIAAVYDFASTLLGIPRKELEKQMETNFKRLFGTVLGSLQ